MFWLAVLNTKQTETEGGTISLNSIKEFIFTTIETYTASR